MGLMKSFNVFLDGDQYKEIKELGHLHDRTYSEIIREGISMVLKKYGRKSNKKTRVNGDA